MSFKINGLDDLQRQLDDIQTAAGALNGEVEIALEDLFNSSFMEEYTSHDDFGAFLSAGNFDVENQEDFDAIPIEKLDTYIQSSTSFDSWEDMVGQAYQSYALDKLGL